MWPALLLSSLGTGLALGLARLKVLAVIPATIVLSLAAIIWAVVFSFRWDAIALAVIAATTLLQTSYMIGGLLSEAPSPHAAPRTSLQLDLIRGAQFAIGQELRTQFETPHDLPRPLRTRIEQLAIRYG